MKPAGVSLIAAPGFLAGYGLVRLVGMSDGHYGPGLDWQTAHVLGLAGMIFFVPAVLFLGGLLPSRPWRYGTVAVTLIGLAASMVQFGADIVFALRADDKAGMRVLSRQFSDIPGVDLAFYKVGPQLFFVGLLVVTVLLARAGQVPWWSPALVLAGIVLPPVTLDLIPVSGVLMLVAFLPVVLRDSRRSSANQQGAAAQTVSR